MEIATCWSDGGETLGYRECDAGGRCPRAIPLPDRPFKPFLSLRHHIIDSSRGINYILED